VYYNPTCRVYHVEDNVCQHVGVLVVGHAHDHSVHMCSQRVLACVLLVVLHLDAVWLKTLSRHKTSDALLS